tara:strand:+ start:1916 stop:2218 length:303 start_codon:yes stop_codon:yes gene_type:complete
VRKSNPFVKPHCEKLTPKTWLYWETFPTDQEEAMLKYHMEGFFTEYGLWKNRLYKSCARRANQHLIAIEKLGKTLRREIRSQKAELGDTKQILDNGYEEI